MKKLNSAFTLVELLVVILIMGILVSVGVANYRDFGRRQEIENVAQQIASDINFAKSNAISNTIPAGCAGTFNGMSFQVVSTSPPARYRIRGDCSSGLSPVVKEVTLPTTVRLIAQSPNPLLFRSVTGGTSMSANSTRLSVCAVNSSIQDMALVITKNGSIIVQFYNCP